jgi:hypothetical protein
MLSLIDKIRKIGGQFAPDRGGQLAPENSRKIAALKVVNLPRI